MTTDEYLTVAGEGTFRLEEKNSRFHALACGCDSEGRAREVLDSQKKRYPDASHHVYAYRVMGPDGALQRSSDDGEPAGTAGEPVLASIKDLDLYDLTVVVSRFFGGTKLGRGGLIRCYRKAAGGALRRAPTRVRVLGARVVVTVPYDYIGVLYDTVEQVGGAVQDVRYCEGVEADVFLARRCRKQLGALLKDRTRGQATVDI